GLPRDADVVFDVRFLPSPHCVDRLRSLPGTDGEVRSYVRGQRPYGEFMRRLRALLDAIVPGYVAEGKAYLTMAVGCTGGRHRSVVVADELADYFRKRGHRVSLDHRDLDRSDQPTAHPAIPSRIPRPRGAPANEDPASA